MVSHSILSPVVFSKNASIKYEISFNSCHEPFPYETATVAVYLISPSVSNMLQVRNRSQSSNLNSSSTNDKEPNGKEMDISDVPCGKNMEGRNSKPIYIKKFVKVSNVNGRSQITFVVS